MMTLGTLFDGHRSEWSTTLLAAGPVRRTGLVSVKTTRPSECALIKGVVEISRFRWKAGLFCEPDFLGIEVKS